MNHTTPHHTTHEPELYKCDECNELHNEVYTVLYENDHYTVCEKCEQMLLEQAFYCDGCNQYRCDHIGYFTNIRFINPGEYLCYSCFCDYVLSGQITVKDIEQIPFNHIPIYTGIDNDEIIKAGFRPVLSSEKIDSQADYQIVLQWLVFHGFGYKPVLITQNHFSLTFNIYIKY